MKASKMIEIAESYLDYNEEDGSFKEIIDLYNSQDPLPVNYKVKYTDQWCATFVSAVALKAGYEDFPFECSCPRMIKELKKMDCWIENDAYYPKAGDLILYDWSDKGKGDDRNEPDHVGIVQRTIGNKIYVIEGNYHHKVGIRKIEVDGRYIRGFGKLDYEQEIHVGDLVDYDIYEYRGVKVKSYSRGIVVYITKNEYVVDQDGKIILVNKEDIKK